MYRFFILCMLCTITCVVEGQVRSTMIDIGTYFTRDLKLTSPSVYQSMEVPSFSRCVKVCVLSTACEIITYDTMDGQCYLAGSQAGFQQTTNQRYLTTVPPSAGFVPPYVASLAGACDGNSCPIGTTCIPLSAGGAHCVITECPQLDAVPNASPDPNSSVFDRAVGTEISYICNVGTILSGPSTRTCKADGNWDTMTSMCLITTTTPAPFTGTYIDQGSYTVFVPAMEICSGSLPLINSVNFANALATSMAGSPGRCFQCPDILVAVPMSSTMYSDNWPGIYQSYTSCSCLFNSNKSNYKIQLDIGDLDIESCCDELLVYDGSDSTAEVLGVFSGHSTGIQTLISTTNALYIEFRTDQIVQHTGFSIVYTEVSSATSSSVPITVVPSQMNLWVWVLGHIDEEQKIWTKPNGTPMLNQPVMYPSLAYRFDYHNNTGSYYNGVPFADYRLCFGTVYRTYIGVESDTHRCHVACYSA